MKTKYVPVLISVPQQQLDATLAGLVQKAPEFPYQDREGAATFCYLVGMAFLARFGLDASCILVQDHNENPN